MCLMLLTGAIKWIWGPAEQKMFEALKTVLCTAPILVAPDPHKPFIIKCKYGIGAVISQGTGKEERVIAYHSRNSFLQKGTVTPRMSKSYSL